MEIGIDIGGTKIAAGLVHNGKVLRRMQVPTPKSRARIIATLHSLIAHLSQGKKYPVGIGVPGAFKRAKIVSLRHVPTLDGVDLAKVLKRTVILLNDSHAFALAESAYGAGKGASSMVGIIIGTGVGGGIIIDGKLYIGLGAAGELGHMRCDLLGNDWESYLGGPYILAKHKAAGGKERTLADLWTSNSAKAKQTRKQTIHVLSLFLLSIQRAFDSQVIVIGGGVAMNHPLVEEVRKALPKHMAVRKAKLADAGIIGAALVARGG